MKKLDDFIAKLGDNAQQNIELILKEIDKNVKSIKNIAYTYELSKLLVSECLKKDIKNKEKSQKVLGQGKEANNVQRIWNNTF